jgi:hypothetical protein
LPPNPDNSSLWVPYYPFRRNRQVAHRGLVLDLDADHLTNGSAIHMPRLQLLNERRGFPMDFWIQMTELTSGLDRPGRSRRQWREIALTTSDRYTLNLTMNDDQHNAS